jgi:L-alanine-DL-glutamate epimerase-like enolase superfamily enzyme
MKIVGIDVFQVSYSLLDQKYSWSNDLFITDIVSTIVRVSTDAGVVGYGEVCPLGSAYMDAFAKGVPAAIPEFGPALIGMDPLQLNLLNERMDLALGGHNYAKSPVDIACWDILGKVSGLPVATLMGGRYRDGVPPYRAISQRKPEEMAQDVLKYRAIGYRRFQLKVGGNANDDIDRIRQCRAVLERDDILVADANTGWLPHEALRVVNGVRDIDVYIEQPCATLDECLVVRRNTTLPFVLDEIILGTVPLVEAHRLGAMDVVNLKISRLGGLTKAKGVRDLCQSLGIAMTLEDSWGGDITTAAIAHFAGSTRAEHYFTATDFNSYVDVELAMDAPRMKDGLLPVPATPGLGITVLEERLGDPVVRVS